MQEFSEQQFPVDISYGMSGGPEYSTDIIETRNGNEQRNVNWLRGRGIYNVAHGVRTQIQLEKLIAFFRSHKGRAIGFRFKDWCDYQAHNQQIAVCDGKQQRFFLIKTYNSGKLSEVRPITKPVNNTVQIMLNGKLQAAGYNVDYKAGIIEFTKTLPQGTIITANFEFDVPVRFDTDKLSASIDNYGVYSWQNIPLIEII
jgi:uncharacterized protein (TIGR02217 family)